MPTGETKIAKRYARALFDIAMPNDLQRAREALSGFAVLFAEHESLRQALGNPISSFNDRAAVLRALAEKLSPGFAGFANFLCILLQNGRLNEIAAVAAAFEDFYQDFRQLIGLEITSAFSLSADEQRDIEHQVRHQLGREATVTWLVDSAIIGGLVIKAGDKLLDGSVRGSLERAHSALV